MNIFSFLIIKETKDFDLFFLFTLTCLDELNFTNVKILQRFAKFLFHTIKGLSSNFFSSFQTLLRTGLQCCRSGRLLTGSGSGSDLRVRILNNKKGIILNGQFFFLIIRPPSRPHFVLLVILLLLLLLLLVLLY